MADLELRSISKDYSGGVNAVDNVSLSIRNRDFAVLVGPSGCGKSTVLRMIAGLEEPSSGEIFLDGRDITRVPPKDRDMAMLFQNAALYPHMTVEENIAFPLKIRKIKKSERRTLVHEAAAILGIEDILSRMPHTLSGGQKQRVAIGRVIVRKPKLFLYDEPLSGLDAQMRHQLRMEIAAIHAKLSATTIYVTHDQTEAMTLGSRIIVMNESVIQQSGPPLELYRHPANIFVAGFIGTPPVNLFPVTIDGDVLSAAGLFETALPEHYSCAALPERAVMALRPEDIIDADFSGQKGVMTARAVCVEHLGSDTYVCFSAGAVSFTVKYDPSVLISAGEERRFCFNSGKILLFDADTGTLIECSR